MTGSALLPSEPPPAITVWGNVTVTPGSRAVLTCHVASTVNFNLTWLRAGHDARLDPRVHVLTNLSLQVSPVSPDQSGWYECVAINEGGVTAERIFLTVEGKVSATVQKQLLVFTVYRITCQQIRFFLHIIHVCVQALVCGLLALVCGSDPPA